MWNVLIRPLSSSFHSAKQPNKKLDHLYPNTADIDTHRYDVGFEGTDWNFVVEVSTIKSQVRSVGPMSHKQFM